MQQTYRLPDPGKVAFLNGLIFGLAGAVINVLVTVLLTFLVPGLLLLWLIISWLVGLTAFFLAGLFAARRTGRVGTATLAGLWAGIFNGVLPCILYGILLAVVVKSEGQTLFQTVASQSSSALTPDIMSNAIRASIIMFITFCILVNIGMGAAIAFFGGLAGRKKGQNPNQSTPFPPYPGQQPPYPGQQQPYGQPPYPGQQPPYPYGGPGQPY